MNPPMAAQSEDQPAMPRRRPLREVALASGLVTAADLDAVEAALRGLPPTGAGASEPEGDRQHDAAVTAALVEQGKLTAFQAREILAGRTRFRLGQYTVIDEIGRGGMGQVFEAEHALMGRHVAVKVLPRAKATPESEAAFRREMRILGRLDHENLVRAFDAGYDAMVYYLVTELVPGIDLRRHVRTYGPLDEVAAASIFSQAARGLAFAHAQRVVHRDVKPGNILVMDDGRVKLLDLGLAGSSLEAEAIRLGRVVGTMDYIAPEQIRTPDDVGPAADIYALGCSMYFAFAGTVPFPGGTRKEKMRRHLTETPIPIQRLVPHLPRQMCDVVEAMMAKSTADRIGSAEAVIQHLARWAPERPTPLPRRPRGEWAPPVPAADLQADSSGAGAGAEPAWPIVDAPALFVESRSAREAPDEGGEIWSLFQQALRVMRASRPVGVAVWVLVPVLAGVGLAIVLTFVRGIDPREYDELFGRASPAVCGWAACLFVVAAQVAARLGRQHR